MGVAALVLGIIAVLLAFFGGIGGIVLGIAAVILGVLGRRAAERDGLPTGSATAGLVTGIVGVVLGGLIFAACLKCASGCAEAVRGLARLGEAQATVDQIFRLEAAYYETEHLDPQGSLLPGQFVSAGPTPAKVPCQDRPLNVTQADWAAAGWGTLQFGFEGATPFQFETVATGTGKTAQVTIIVRTDPNCKGVPAEVRHRMAVDEEGRPYVQHTTFGGGPASRPGRRPLRQGPGALAPGAPPPEVEPPLPDGDERVP
jgi:hypothetical protein